MDLIVSNNGLNNVADLSRALAVCARLSRPRGAAEVSRPTCPGRWRGSTTCSAGRSSEAGVADGRAADCRAHPGSASPRGGAPGADPDRGVRRENASIHGFRWCFASAEALFRHHFVRLAFLDPWRALVPNEARPEVFRRLGETLDREALRPGDTLHLHLRAPEVTVVPEWGNPVLDRTIRRRPKQAPGLRGEAWTQEAEP